MFADSRHRLESIRRALTGRILRVIRPGTVVDIIALNAVYRKHEQNRLGEVGWDLVEGRRLWLGETLGKRGARQSIWLGSCSCKSNTDSLDQSG